METSCRVFENVPVKNWDEVFFVIRTLIDSASCFTSIYSVTIDQICERESSLLIPMIEDRWRKGYGESIDAILGKSIKDLTSERRIFIADIVKDVSPTSHDSNNLKETEKIGKIKLVTNYKGQGTVSVSSNKFMTNVIKMDNVKYEDRVVYKKYTDVNNEPNLFNEHDIRYDIAFLESNDCEFDSIQKILNLLNINPLTEETIYYVFENYASVVTDVNCAINFTPLLNISDNASEEVIMGGWEVTYFHDDNFHFRYRRNRVEVEVTYNPKNNIGSVMVKSKNGIDNALNIKVVDLEKIRQHLINVVILRQN
ncbi:hypothetical protein CVV43_01720 [Candidatus Saccharibacteria bacterium HGW-Saccharibacteria-1]|nr:MAG: hypothetical protein CVV43_01720 [Candidatus Saccharibacteria bacterium HGW-Saccharibacteria-1]